jgi:hypothetical protein
LFIAAHFHQVAVPGVEEDLASVAVPVDMERVVAVERLGALIDLQVVGQIGVEIGLSGLDRLGGVSGIAVETSDGAGPGRLLKPKPFIMPCGPKPAIMPYLRFYIIFGPISG